MTGDPHAEYRRQAAAHFGLDRGAAPSTESDGFQPSTPSRPRIFRAADSVDGAVRPLQSAISADATERMERVNHTTTRPPTNTGKAPRPLTESTERFAAGTTYGASGRPQIRPVLPPAPVASPPPTSHRPPPPQSSVPPPPRMPPPSMQPPPPAPRPWAPPEQLPPGNAAVPQGNPAGFNVLPYHVCRVACALAVIAAIFATSMFGWFVIAVGCAGAEWYTRTRHVGWPADVQDLLHRIRAAAPPPDERRTEPATAVIPFRPLTVQDIFVGAFRVVLRNWPTLVGIPAVILVGFVIFAGVVMYILFVVFSEVLTPMLGGMFMSTMESGSAVFIVTVIMVGYFVFISALALPADALLLSTSVIATDKAVRGERVRLIEVFSAARSRIFAVCRLTLVFYGVCFLPDIILTFAIFTVGLGPAFMWILFACFGVSFVVGILLSLSPIVLIVEERGVADALRRSMQLAKPAWGRLIGIHLLWAVCATGLMMLSWVPMLIFGDLVVLVSVPYLVAIPFMISYFRTVQMLIYTDLRIRQESYERELLADWTRNTQFTQ